uniref:Uncharacterized protein n=1 Tax=Globodera rostochiensis TaxID=31243 RepID=A0A914HT20_GLORO
MEVPTFRRRDTSSTKQKYDTSSTKPKTTLRRRDISSNQRLAKHIRPRPRFGCHSCLCTEQFFSVTVALQVAMGETPDICVPPGVNPNDFGHYLTFTEKTVLISLLMVLLGGIAIGLLLSFSWCLFRKGVPRARSRASAAKGSADRLFDGRYKALSVKLELKTFDEIFGEGWWDKGEAEDLKTPAPTNFGQNVHHQIDRQNTQIGQIEPNSIDQLGQIEPNSTDQNSPLTESDHSDNPKNGEEQNEIASHENVAEDKRKHKIVAKKLGLSERTIYDWKQKLGQTAPKHIYAHSEQKKLMKSYYEIKDKNSKISDEKIAKMLKIGTRTLAYWKKQFKRQQFHPNSVDGHSVEENAAANVQEIGISNSGSI